MRYAVIFMFGGLLDEARGFETIQDARRAFEMRKKEVRPEYDDLYLVDVKSNITIEHYTGEEG